MFSKMFDFFYWWNEITLHWSCLFVKIARAMLLSNAAITRTWISSFFICEILGIESFKSYKEFFCCNCNKLPCSTAFQLTSISWPQSERIPVTTTSSIATCTRERRMKMTFANVCEWRKTFFCCFPMAQWSKSPCKNFILSNSNRWMTCVFLGKNCSYSREIISLAPTG